MNCAWLSLTKGTPCMWGCGVKLPRDYEEPPVHPCEGPPQPRLGHHKPLTPTAEPGLGDEVESLLKSIGITQDRWNAVKAAVGLPGTCGCSDRKEALNQWGERVKAWWRGQ